MCKKPKISDFYGGPLRLRVVFVTIKLMKGVNGMKKIVSMACAVLLLLSVTACAREDADYRHGMAQLTHGNYAKAYEHFKGSTAPRAAEELERLVFVPTREVSFSSFKTAKNERNYTYDARGNLICEQTLFEGVRSRTEYTYNEKNWLMTVQRPNSTQTFTYDEQGNCLTYVHEMGESGTYKEEYEYDAQGKLIKTRVTMVDGTKMTRYPPDEEQAPVPEDGGICTYDEEGRLLTQTYGNGEKCEFTYDAYGNKITERYIWNDTEIEWQYEWILLYYPDGVNGPAKTVREQTVEKQPVA